MRELVVQIPESEYDFVLKLLRQFQFLNVLEGVAPSPEKMEALRSIQQGLEEARQIQRGALPKRTIQEFLAELD